MAPVKMPYHKLVVMGGGAVGKTALVKQMVFGEHIYEYDPTIEDSYRKQTLIDQQACVLDILDTAGQEEYSAMREAYMKEGECYILVYSVVSRESFKVVATYYDQLKRVKAAHVPDPDAVLRNPVVCLVGNKSDLDNDREVSVREGLALAKTLGCMFIETSAQRRHNVERMFEDVVRLMRKQRRLFNISEDDSMRLAIEQLQKDAIHALKSRHGVRSRFSISQLFGSSTSKPRITSPPLTVVQQGEINQLLVQAAKKDWRKTVVQLLALGANIDEPCAMDGSALYASVSAGHIHMVKLLLKHKASVNAIGLVDQVPLHAASIGGNVPLIEMLLDHKANIEALCKIYGTPLQAAAARGQVYAVRTLITRGANVNATGSIYGNALQAVAWNGHAEIAEALLNAGANLHARGDGDCTALQVASTAGRHEIVRLLILRKANIHDSRGRYGSPLTAATARSHSDVMNLLYESGAKDEEIEVTPDEQEETVCLELNSDAFRVVGSRVHPDNEAQYEQSQRDNHAHSYPAREKSKEWLNYIVESACNKQIAQGFLPTSNDGVRPSRIKIAILDTGCDIESDFFNVLRARRSRLKGWKDWACAHGTPCDINGHGTHVTSLCMKVAPYADVYVARIAKDMSDLPNASENIAKAILWAALEWQVDVISMSFGFQSEVLVDQASIVSNAIFEAVQKRDSHILFFAAAANHGGNDSEMFPARHQCVIPIRGTNSQGVFQDYNPPADPNGPVVYGTLGTEVPSHGLSAEKGLIYKSGTSVATPIAAGIAALFLSYANIAFSNHVNSIRSPVKQLRTKTGMLSMFYESSRFMDSRQLYLSARKFLDMTEEQRLASITIAAAKAK